MSDPLGLTGNVDALVCDLTSGMCGTGEASAQRVTVTYVTDPICSACWAMEPAWRAVQYRFGDLLDVRHVYGGLLPSWDGFADPANGIRGFGDVGHHWRQIAEQTGQALNASVWDVDPIESSFPPSMVLAAARDTAPELDGLLLRRLREDLFVHGRNIARPQVWGPVLSRAGSTRRRWSSCCGTAVLATCSPPICGWRGACGSARSPPSFSKQVTTA